VSVFLALGKCSDYSLYSLYSLHSLYALYCHTAGYFTGVVVSYDALQELYTVRYEDEDEESISLKKLRAILVK
jgi:hypothetical protein